MRLGLSMLFCISEPLSAAVKRLDKIDVEHIELVDEGPHALTNRRVSMLKKFLKARDLHLTVHAPFADINIASTSPMIRRAILRRLKKSIRLSSQLNPEYWIFHPGLQGAMSKACPGLDWKINLESVRELLEEAKEHDLKIAIENVPDPYPFLLKRTAEFKRFYEDLGGDGSELGLTFDVGHANITGETYKFIEEFHDKIVHTHLHDNEGYSDLHLGIGSGNVDWSRFIRVLKKINYRGTLVIESMSDVEESIRKIRTLINH